MLGHLHELCVGADHRMRMRLVPGPPMKKRSNARHRKKVIRLFGIAKPVIKIVAADVQHQAVTRGNHNAGGEDLDVEFDWFAGDKRQSFVGSVIGAVGQAAIGVQLGLRGAQPAEPDADPRIVGADEQHLVTWSGHLASLKLVY